MTEINSLYATAFSLRNDIAGWVDLGFITEDYESPDLDKDYSARELINIVENLRAVVLTYPCQVNVVTELCTYSVIATVTVYPGEMDAVISVSDVDGQLFDPPRRIPVIRSAIACDESPEAGVQSVLAENLSLIIP